FLQPGDQGRRTPYILGTPKTTAFQHYLVQPLVEVPDGLEQPAGNDPRTLCNFHYPLTPEPHELLDNQGKIAALTGGTVIRGHKRYWHQPRPTDRERFDRGLARPDDSQYTIIRPVRAGTVFKGRVRFENLTDVELGALLTVLQLKPSQRHHLG